MDETDEEIANFCGTISLAALQLGIFARVVNDGGAFRVEWLDAQTMKKIRGESAPSKRDAFINGCMVLRDYLSVPTNERS